MNCCDLLYYAKFDRKYIAQNIMRSNADSELLYLLSGSCKVFFDGVSFVMDSGDIVIIPANVRYRFECAGKISFAVIGFNNCSLNFKNRPAFFKGYDNVFVSDILLKIQSEFENYKYGRKKMLNLLLGVALIDLFRNTKACDNKKDMENDNFNYILNLMNSHSNNGLDIEEVAKMSGLSYHRFRHRFKELISISPQQYIIKQRIEFAKRLLETTDYNTSLIAEACDFHSVPQFITCFSKFCGVTPVKYRKAIKQNKVKRIKEAV